ncbi:hypothetical protein [Homoserinimonas sp. A520]
MAELLSRRNAIDAQIASVIGRPMTSGHLGEWVASRVFDIELEKAANAKGIDGRFRSGPLAGQTVNLKWYLKREGILDMTPSALPDYYLVLSGPISTRGSSSAVERPWRIDAVYLFDARGLNAAMVERGIKVGTASSVRNADWSEAEVFPRANNPALKLTAEQQTVLHRFAFAV